VVAEAVQKLFVLLKAPAGADRAAFMKWVLATAASLDDGLPGLSELIVDLVDVDPGSAQWVRPGEPVADLSSPPFDAVIELAGSEDLLLDSEALVAGRFRVDSGSLWMYRTTLMPARIDRQRSPGGRSPGVKYIVLCRFHDDLPPSSALRSWAHHVPLALRIHIGVDIYIRHWVDTIITPGAPLIQGITELHFPTWEDMRDRWFVDESGRQQIIQDIGHFLASGIRLYTSEHVLKTSDLA
jgi:hypothetical protein